MTLMYSYLVFVISAAFLILHCMRFADIHQWLVVWIDNRFRNGNALENAMWAAATPQMMIGYSLIDRFRALLFDDGIAPDNYPYTIVALTIMVAGVSVGNFLYWRSRVRMQMSVEEGELQMDLNAVPTGGGIAYAAYAVLALSSLLVVTLISKMGLPQ